MIQNVNPAFLCTGQISGINTTIFSCAVRGDEDV